MKRANPITFLEAAEYIAISLGWSVIIKVSHKIPAVFVYVPKQEWEVVAFTAGVFRSKVCAAMGQSILICYKEAVE
jgi:hypothetical protein